MAKLRDIWTTAGRLVYSDPREGIGTSYPGGREPQIPRTSIGRYANLIWAPDQRRDIARKAAVAHWGKQERDSHV